MLKNRHQLVCCLILLVLNGPMARAQDVAPKKESNDSKPVTSSKQKTYVVSKSPFKIEVTLKGVFEAKKMSEVVLRPDVWSKLVVMKAVDQGAHVKKGDTLVTLDTKKIDEELNDLEYSRRLAELTLKQAQNDLRHLSESLPFDLRNAERSKQIAGDDLAYFLNIDRDLRIRSAKESLKRSEYSLENAQEELKQLEQMYKADDLTEETEEIILKRARRSVESSKYFLDSSRIRTERTLKTTLPREEEKLKEAARKQALDFEKVKASLPRQLRQKETELEKLTYAREKSDDRFEKLKNDRQNLTVKSPADGIAYYGSCVRGKWSPATTLAKQLRRGGTLSANQVFMTIVQSRPMFVRANLPEKELQHIHPGVAGKAVPTAYPDVKLAATIDSISQIPIEAGTFDARIRIDLRNKAAEKVVPGMACTVKLVAYQKEDALTVPPSAVFSEELDEDQKFLYLALDGGGHEKRPVVVGRKNDKQSEILEGLKADDKILLQKPE